MEPRVEQPSRLASPTTSRPERQPEPPRRKLEGWDCMKGDSVEMLDAPASSQAGRGLELCDPSSELESSNPHLAAWSRATIPKGLASEGKGESLPAPPPEPIQPRNMITASKLVSYTP